MIAAELADDRVIMLATVASADPANLDTVQVHPDMSAPGTEITMHYLATQPTAAQQVLCFKVAGRWVIP